MKFFAIIYSYISILENEIPITNVSPKETSKHLKVRHEITLLSSYLNIIKEKFHERRRFHNIQNTIYKKFWHGS